MKTMKKTIAYILALTCCFSGTAVISGNHNTLLIKTLAEAAEEKTYGDYSYIVYDKIDGVCSTPCVEITKYNSTESSLTIPEKIDGYPVVSMSGDAFKENPVYEINISSSVKRFGENFVANAELCYVIIDNKFEFYANMTANPADSEKMTVEGFQFAYSYPPEDNTIVEDIEIPETVCGLPVTSIANCAFENNMNIRSVKIPDTVKYFERRIFVGSSLQSVNIPKALKVIPSATFKGCKKLKSVDFHENVVVAKTAFQDTDFSVPDNVKVSEENTPTNTSYDRITVKSEPLTITIFTEDNQNEYACEIVSYDPETISGKTADVVIPDYFCEIPVTKVNSLFWSLCDDCKIDLNSIVFPSGMSKIEKITVNNPETIKSVTIKADNVFIYKNAFQDTGVVEITLNGSCTLEPMAFMNCKNLEKVEFTGDSPTININHDAFKNCTSLTEVIFPENMTADFKIDAFGSCSAVKKLVLNGNINIASHAFRECDSLENLTLKGNITLDADSFSDCRKLNNLAIDTDKSINGCAFNGCANLLNINSAPVFSASEKNFNKEIKDFVFSNFNDADDVGFINLYVTEQVNNVVDRYITDDMTDMQKIKTIHDWVCNNAVYDYDNISAQKNHNDASIFMNDSSVCEGYAKCYNLLLNAAGIETYYLLGDNHAWNVVKLGGHYFHSDTTWDDGEIIDYEWFLKSDSEALAETSSHAVWNFRTPSTLHSFQKKTLPECRYSMGDLNTDGETTIADLVMLDRYLLGQSAVSADDIVLADLTYDGVTDIFDLVRMRQLLLKK